jgi:hypothetical protein
MDLHLRSGKRNWSDAGGTMKTPRILPLVAALGLFATLIASTAGLALAWSAPSIASVCATDQAVHNWTVTLAVESDYHIQWAGDAAFTSPTTVLMHAGANSLATPASVTTLFVRWASDHSSKSSAAWAGGACPTPSPTEPPTPSPTEPPTPSPTASSTQAELIPVQSLQGATSDPTATPVQVVEGVTSAPTATPPSTSAGSGPSNGSGSPLFALLVALVFGGFGLLAVEGQRRKARR